MKQQVQTWINNLFEKKKRNQLAYIEESELTNANESNQSMAVNHQLINQLLD